MSSTEWKKWPPKRKGLWLVRIPGASKPIAIVRTYESDNGEVLEQWMGLDLWRNEPAHVEFVNPTCEYKELTV